MARMAKSAKKPNTLMTGQDTEYGHVFTAALSQLSICRWPSAGVQPVDLDIGIKNLRVDSLLAVRDTSFKWIFQKS